MIFCLLLSFKTFTILVFLVYVTDIDLLVVYYVFVLRIVDLFLGCYRGIFFIILRIWGWDILGYELYSYKYFIVVIFFFSVVGRESVVFEIGKSRFECLFYLLLVVWVILGVLVIF